MSKKIEVIYGFSQSLGWAWILNRLLTALTDEEVSFEAVQGSLQVYVLLSLFEIRSARGALRIATRLFAVWLGAVLPEVGDHPAYMTAILAWGLSDLPRYIHNLFETMDLGKSNHLFMLYKYSYASLRPIAFAAECLIIYAGFSREGVPVPLPGLGEVELALSKVSTVIMAIHIPASLYMYKKFFVESKTLGSSTVDSEKEHNKTE